MADNTTYTPGTGATIAADDVGGVLFQRVKVTHGADGAATDASATAPLPVSADGGTPASTSGAIAAAGTGTVGPLDVSRKGNVSFIVKNTVAASAWAGAPVLVFEQSDDNTSWAPLLVRREMAGGMATTWTLAANSANTSQVFDAGVEGTSYVRVRATTGPTTNGLTIVIAAGGLAFSPMVSATVSNIRPSPLNVTGNAASQTPPTIGGTGTIHVSGAATVAATALVAAPGAGLSIYVTDIETTNAGAAAQTITLFEGTTNARFVRYMAAGGGGGVTNLRTPWKLPAATALGYAVGAAQQYYMTVSYFVAP